MKAYVPERQHNPFVTSATGGRVLSALMLPWFRLLPPRGFGVLTTIGRKTGKRRPRCVRVIRRGNRGYMAAIGGEATGWLKNLRANPEASLRVRGGTFTVRVREPTSAAEAAEAVEVYCGTLNRTDYAECLLHRKGLPTRSKIAQLHRIWFSEGTPLVVEFEDATTA